MEVLKSLAYNIDDLGARNVARLYGNFIRKIEKGKFKWGSRSAVREFLRQVNYKVCGAKRSTLDVNIKFRAEKGKFKGKEDKPFYCLD